MATTTDEFGGFYDERLAASDLRRYREKGPRPWTRTLIESLKTEGVEGATLLDIGGGVGVIHHELLAPELPGQSLWAHPPPTLTAKAESERRGYGGRVTYRHGDFVELAESIPPADIVTLDRVINVCPDQQRLDELSAACSQRLYGLGYPRDRRFVRLVIFATNLVLRVRGKGCR